MTNAVTPSDWGKNVEELDGVDVYDKAELIGVPFLITAVRFQQSTRGYDQIWVDAQLKDGTPFRFVDSSTGVKAQLESYLETKKLMPKGNDEIVPLGLLISRGMRVSQFEAVDQRSGKLKPARTYYLTTSGKV